jgi:hypothetical protein
VENYVKKNKKKKKKKKKTLLMILNVQNTNHTTGPTAVMGTIPKKVSRYDTDTSNFDDTIADTILYRVVKVSRYRQSI